MKSLVLILFLPLISTFAMAQLDTVKLNEVVIETSRLQYSSGLHQSQFDSTTLSEYNTRSLSNLLSDNCAANMKIYGNGGLSGISLRGGSVYHTAILWNGIPLTSPLHGMTDLALQKNIFFDDVLIEYGGASTQWGSGAVSGNVFLNNHPSFNSGILASISLAAGSFSETDEAITVSYGNEKYYGSLKCFNENNKNNFLFRDENNVVKEQIHSEIKQKGLMLENYFRIGNNSILSYSFWHSYSNREIPPALFQIDTLANQKDINNRHSFEWKYFSQRNSLTLKSAIFHERLNYNDDLFIQPSENKCLSLINEALYEHKISKRHSLSIGINNTYNTSDSSANLINATIKRFSLFGLYHYLSKNECIDLSVGIRKEYSSLQNVPLVYSAGANYRPYKSLSLRVAVSTVYRNPTINDLYWSPGGNSNLKPESGYSFETGFESDIIQILNPGKTLHHSKLKINTTGYYKMINDWIIWYPSSILLWSPLNLSRVESYGTETGIQYQYTNNKVSTGIDAGYFYTISKNQKAIYQNDASKNKQLIYVPVNRINLTINFIYSGYRLTFNHSYTGYRYTSSDNSTYLDPFSVSNVRLEKLFRAGDYLFRPFIRVDNLFDSNYQSVQNRPMPLRSYEGGLSLTFKK